MNEISIIIDFIDFTLEKEIMGNNLPAFWIGHNLHDRDLCTKVDQPNSIHYYWLQFRPFKHPNLSRKISKILQDFDKINALMPKWVTCQSLIGGTPGENLSANRYIERRFWGVYGMFMTPLAMGGFIISWQIPSRIHKNHNFNRKIIIGLEFDPWNKHTLLKNMCPSWNWPQDTQIPNYGGNSLPSSLWGGHRVPGIPTFKRCVFCMSYNKWLVSIQPKPTENLYVEPNVLFISLEIQ